LSKAARLFSFFFSLSFFPLYLLYLFVPLLAVKDSIKTTKGRRKSRRKKERHQMNKKKKTKTKLRKMQMKLTLDSFGGS